MSITLFKRIMLCGVLMMTSCFAIAKEFTCPSIDDLTRFEGFYIDYPLSLDIQTQYPDTWLVGQIRINQKESIVDTLIISPVKAVSGEYPTDSAAKMIPSFQLLDGYPKSRTIDQTQLSLCAYWSSVDGSIASFVHMKDKKAALQSPNENMSLAIKAIAQQSHE